MQKWDTVCQCEYGQVSSNKWCNIGCIKGDIFKQKTARVDETLRLAISSRLTANLYSRCANTESANLVGCQPCEHSGVEAYVRKKVSNQKEIILFWFLPCNDHRTLGMSMRVSQERESLPRPPIANTMHSQAQFHHHLKSCGKMES